jgi:hypothetical protein
MAELTGGKNHAKNSGRRRALVRKGAAFENERSTGKDTCVDFAPRSDGIGMD